jgi:hypothetical protein
MHSFYFKKLPLSLAEMWQTNLERNPDRALRNANGNFIPTHRVETVKRFFFFLIFFWGIFSLFVHYIIQHCFICRPSDSTVPTDAGIEPKTVATSALAVRRSNH